MKRLYFGLVLIVLFSACSAKNSQNEGETQAAEATDGVVSDGGSDSSSAKSEQPEDLIPEGAIRILYLGDSITAGYGLGEEYAFPAIVQRKAEEAGYSMYTVNAGISGDTSTGGLNRLEWLLQQQFDVVLLELGGNDGLRGIDLQLTKANLDQIIQKTLQKWPETKFVVAGMMVPPNLGHAYTQEFAAIFPAIAKKHNAALIPFILEGVGGIPSLNLSDGIHPTAEGHKILAETVWKALEPVLKTFNATK